ncbi:MAG TPA: YbjN domain-containing protein [Candidatus Limnocylindria bacterium]|nr:YbjN domain-containing protein [Candidatus Limnocylindria bacterium]
MAVAAGAADMGERWNGRQKGKPMTATLEIIAREELTIPKLNEVYKQAYMNSEIGADGDIKLELDNIKIYVKTETEKKILRLYTVFGTKPGATRQQVLELCNRINDGLVMLRASCPAAFPTPALWLDHDLDIETGMAAEDIVSETRRFRTVIGAVPGLDTEDILK